MNALLAAEAVEHDATADLGVIQSMLGSIARAFGTTVQHVQTTVAGLAEKLKTFDITKK